MSSKILVKFEFINFFKVNISIDYFIYVGKPCHDIRLQFAVQGFNCQKLEIIYLRDFTIEAPRLVSLVLGYTVFSEDSEYDIYTIYIFCIWFLLYLIILIWNRSW